jgi:O-antigen ligase
VNLLIAGTLFSYLLHGRLQRTGSVLQRPLVWLYLVPITLAALLGAVASDEIHPRFYDMAIINFYNPIGYVRDMFVRPMFLVVMALMLGAAAARSQKPERFLVAIGLSVWVIALVEIVYVAASGIQLGLLASPRFRTFFRDLGLHANDLGRLFAVAYALLLFPWWETKNATLKTFLFVTMGVLSIGLLLTFSRGAFIGFLLVNALFLAWKLNAKTVALALVAGAVCALFMPDYVVNRLLVGVDQDANAVSAGRIEEIWLPLAPEIAKTPLWGSGLGSIMWSYPMETGAMLMTTHPHNAYLEAWLDMGVIGLCALLAYYWHVWRGFRALGSNAYLSPELRGFFQGAAAGLLCFLLTGLSGSSLRPTPEFAFLWMAIGMMYGVAARRSAAG